MSMNKEKKNEISITDLITSLSNDANKEMTYLALSGGVEGYVRDKLAFEVYTRFNDGLKHLVLIEHQRIDFALVDHELKQLKSVVELGAFPPNGGSVSQIKNKIKSDHLKLKKKIPDLIKKEFLDGSDINSVDKYSLLLFTQVINNSSDMSIKFVKPSYRKPLNKIVENHLETSINNTNISLQDLKYQSNVIALESGVLAKDDVFGAQVTLSYVLIKL